MIGQKLGHYEILRKVGSGGMGDVYAARDTRLDRDVALKVLPPEVAGDAERRKRFEREARAAAKLSHPGIVTLHSVEDADGEVFITMELVEGRPLSEIVAEGPLPLDRLLDLGGQIADAVATAHEHGITHRDLKPQNVVVTGDGQAKVLDFGLAKFADDTVDPATTHMATASVVTGDGRILGTPAYMSPEQAEGKAVDHRSDVFSLGVVLYEMATGRRPFEGDSAMSVISSVLKDTPPGIGELREELPARLARIVHRCLVKSPRRRYQSARDLASDLEELRDELKEAGTVSRLGSRAGAAQTPRPFPVWIVIAIAAVAVGVGAFGYHLSTSTEEPPPPQERPEPEVAQHRPVIERLQRLTTEYGLEIGPQISSDGKWFVYAASSTGKLDVYRQRVGGMKRTDLTEGSDADDWQPAISPDGEQIAFRSERDGGGIFVMGATGESVRRLTDFGYHPAWSPDGEQLVVTSVGVVNPRSRTGKGQAWIVDVDSGHKREIDTGGDAVHGSWSPDGSRLAFWGVSIGGSSSRSLFTVPSGGGEREPLMGGDGPAFWTPWWTSDGRYVYYSSTATRVMSVWRTGIDQATGEPAGAPEQVVAGVAVSTDYPSLPRSGDRLLFSVSMTSSNIAKIAFDPERGRVEGEPVMITRGANGYTAPDVSPDGEWITFCSAWTRHDTEENIYVAREDGAEIRELTTDVGKGNRLPRWTPDGKSVLFYSNRSGEWEIWIVSSDGSGLRELTDTPDAAVLYAIPEPGGPRVIAWVQLGGLLEFDIDEGFEGSQKWIPPFSEDGQQFIPTDWSGRGDLIAGMVSSSEAALDGVYTFSLQAGEYHKIAGGGTAPRWLDDGRRLVYIDGQGTDIVLVDIEEKRPRPVVSIAPEILSGHLALSPDDRWIYFSIVEEDGDVWLAELE